jgi:demethylmenaquinone methyltransferase / 2-methoxy-6-polyprenyl-1,4-benzoquinol methylase
VLTKYNRIYCHILSLFHSPMGNILMPKGTPFDKNVLPNCIVQSPHPVLKRYYANEAERRLLVNELFDKSARYYDGISKAMVFGTSSTYRRKTLLNAGLAPGMNILDVGCGTGLISHAASKIVGSKGFVAGVDPSLGMIKEGVQSKQLRNSTRAMAEHLPFSDNSFDFVCIAYALRHVSDLDMIFSEFWRVLRNDGKLLVLEITRPPKKYIYNLLKIYLKYIVPTLVRWSTGNMYAQSVMSYYWETIDKCVSSKAIITSMQQNSFAQIKRTRSLGIFYEYLAMKK